MINERIREREVRVIDEEGKQLGVITTEEGRRIALDRGLDLILIAPEAKPPVCKISDFGKFKYEINKKEKDSRKGSRGAVTKEIKMSPRIEDHDYHFKLEHGKEFLEKGHKVKFSIQFKGREMAHTDIGYNLAKMIVEDLKDIGKPDAPASMFNRMMTLIMSPGK